LAPRAGIVSAIDAEQLGRVVIALGGGRRQLGDVLDHSVGLAMRCRIGDRVEPQQPMLSVYSAGGIATEVAKMLNDAIVLTDEPISPPELLVERID
jgi:thymidine phosphorylase